VTKPLPILYDPPPPVAGLTRLAFRAYIFRQKTSTRNVGIPHSALYEAAAKQLGFPTYTTMTRALGWPPVGKAAAQLEWLQKRANPGDTPP